MFRQAPTAQESDGKGSGDGTRLALARSTGSGVPVALIVVGGGSAPDARYMDLEAMGGGVAEELGWLFC